MGALHFAGRPRVKLSSQLIRIKFNRKDSRLAKGLSQAVNGCESQSCIDIHDAAGPADHFFYDRLYGVKLREPISRRTCHWV